MTASVPPKTAVTIALAPGLARLDSASSTPQPVSTNSGGISGTR